MPRRLLWTAKRRADAKGIPLTIVEGDILVPEFCPVLGIKLEPGRGRRGPIDTSPTIDRLDPEIGYTPENIRVISWRANRIKNNATLIELENVAAWLRKELGN